MVFQAHFFSSHLIKYNCILENRLSYRIKNQNIIKKPQLFEKKSLETSSLELQRHNKVRGGDVCFYHCKAILDCSGACYSSVLFLLQEWAIWGETFRVDHWSPETSLWYAGWSNASVVTDFWFKGFDLAVCLDLHVCFLNRN